MRRPAYLLLVGIVAILTGILTVMAWNVGGSSKPELVNGQWVLPAFPWWRALALIAGFLLLGLSQRLMWRKWGRGK